MRQCETLQRNRKPGKEKIRMMRGWGSWEREDHVKKFRSKDIRLITQWLSLEGFRAPGDGAVMLVTRHLPALEPHKCCLG